MLSMSSLFFTGKLGTDEMAASTLGNLVIARSLV